VQESFFSTLIPDSSAKSLSRYTAMVDSRTRDMLDRLAAATDNARIKLKVGTCLNRVEGIKTVLIFASLQTSQLSISPSGSIQ